MSPEFTRAPCGRSGRHIPPDDGAMAERRSTSENAGVVVGEGRDTLNGWDRVDAADSSL
jgi:hypothetical protein